MITPYISQQPVDDFGSRFSNLKYNAALAATTDTSLTVPGNAPSYKALMKTSSTGIVWVSINAAAAVPVGTTFALTNSELLNGEGLCREVKAGDVLHFFTATATTPISVVFFAIGTNN